MAAAQKTYMMPRDSQGVSVIDHANGDAVDTNNKEGSPLYVTPGCCKDVWEDAVYAASTKTIYGFMGNQCVEHCLLLPCLALVHAVCGRFVNSFNDLYSLLIHCVQLKSGPDYQDRRRR